MSHLFLRRKPHPPHLPAIKSWVWPQPSSPHPTSFCKQGSWGLESSVHSHTPSGPRQSLRSPDSSARVLPTVWAISKHRWGRGLNKQWFYPSYPGLTRGPCYLEVSSQDWLLQFQPCRRPPSGQPNKNLRSVAKKCPQYSSVYEKKERSRCDRNIN